MKITARHAAYMSGRAFTLAESRKPSERKITETCPFRYTAPGTKEIDQKHENGLRTAWLKGAMEARADHLAPSKRLNPWHHATARAKARPYARHLHKLTKKGYTLAV